MQSQPAYPAPRAPSLPMQSQPAYPPSVPIQSQPAYPAPQPPSVPMQSQPAYPAPQAGVPNEYLNSDVLYGTGGIKSESEKFLTLQKLLNSFYCAGFNQGRKDRQRGEIRHEFL